MLRNGLPSLSLGKQAADAPPPGACVRTSKIGYSPLTPELVWSDTVVQWASPWLKSPFWRVALPCGRGTGGKICFMEDIATAVPSVNTPSRIATTIAVFILNSHLLVWDASMCHRNRNGRFWN